LEQELPFVFGRSKNDDAKQRKVAIEYVRLCRYKNGEIGKNHTQQCQNGTPEKLTLDEIASQLGMSKRDLQRVLSIERNLTDSMRELLDTGVITKTLASDTLTSLSEEEQMQKRKENKIMNDLKANRVVAWNVRPYKNMARS